MSRDIKYNATLDPSGFNRGTSGILAGLNSMHARTLAVGKGMQQSVDNVTGKWTSLGTMLTGLAASIGAIAFANLIRGAIDSAGRLHDMAQSTGMTVESLSALGSVGKTSETSLESIAAASNKLSKNMAMADEKSSGAGQAIQALGLNLDEFKAKSPEERMKAVADAMAQFQDGASKSAVAIALFGKEGAAMIPFLADLAETGSLQAKVTAEQAAQADEFGDNLIKLRASGEGWKKELATGMLPALNEASKATLMLFNGTGGLRDQIRKLAADGTLVEWTRTAVRGVTYVMDAFQYAGRAVKQLGELIGASAAVMAAVMSGNFRQAFEISKDFFSRSADLWSADTLGAQLRANLDVVKSEVAEITAPRRVLNFQAKADKPVHEKTNMPQYEEELAQAKQLAAEKDALRDYTKEQELAFWQTILTREDVVSKDRIAISKKVADLRTAILREEAKKQRDVDLEVLKGQQEAALDAVEAARMEADGQYRMGLISKAQLLELEKGFEEQRFEIRRQYLQARVALIDPDRDPVAYEQTNQQIEELERQHRMRLRGIQIEAMADSPFARVMKTTEQSFSTAIEGMINRTMTLRQALTSIWAGIRGAIVKEIATIAAREAAAWVARRAIALAGIATDAAKAGSGAASSVASIPYVGPVLAIAALATVMAAVMGAQGKVPSAARGFDIPSGVNPLTQLHEEEMVLPSEIANNFRAMFAVNGGAAAGGAAGGGGAPFVLHPLPGGFYALSENEFLRFFGQMKAQRKV